MRCYFTIPQSASLTAPFTQGGLFIVQGFVLYFSTGRRWGWCFAGRDGVAGHHTPKTAESQGFLWVDLFPWAAIDAHILIRPLLVQTLTSVGVDDIDIKNPPVGLLRVFLGCAIGVDITKIRQNIADILFSKKVSLALNLAILVADLHLCHHPVGDSCRTVENPATAGQKKKQRQKQNKNPFENTHFCAIPPELEYAQNTHFIVEIIRKKYHY